jgi:hypothetical protein
LGGSWVGGHLEFGSEDLQIDTRPEDKMSLAFIVNLSKIVLETVRYQLCLLDYILHQRNYSSSTFYADNKHAKVHCYSVYLMIKFITNPFYTKQKHYRSPSFLHDMKDNLKNVSVPGTGIPLSLFVFNKLLLYFFLLILVPIFCLFGAINQTYQDFLVVNDHNKFHWSEILFRHFYDNLLTSNNWFTLWRYNTHLVTYHSYLTHSIDYQMEDKWKFLKIGKELNIPISPFFDNIESIVCKNILIEGGMGIHFYKNAYYGGNYIIQEKLNNASWLNELLPKNAPLSTMRIITTSTYPLSKDFSEKKLQRLLTEEQNLEEKEQREQMEEENHLKGEHSNLHNNNNNNNNNGANHPHSGTTSDGKNYSFCTQNTSTSVTEDGWKIGGETGSLDEFHSPRGRIAHHNNHNNTNNNHHHNENNEQITPIRRPPNGTTGSNAHSPSSLSSTAYSHNQLTAEEEKEIDQFIRAETAVLRLGRMNAETDHSSILFNVNLSSGEIEPGQVNSHWYQLGLNKVMNTSWTPPVKDVVNHLDPPYPFIAGKCVPDMKEAMKIVTR